MLVCICHGITDSDIENAMQEGASSFKELRNQTGLASCCGQCASFAKEMLNEKISLNQASQAFHLAQEIRI